MSETLRVLDRRWRNACKILLKEEVGQLSEFSGWLEGMIDSNRHEKSSISGKDVSLGVKEYAADARFMSFDEVDFGKKYAPAPLGGADGIGQIASLLSDRFIYVGNLVIGNSRNVERSANISDSFFVYDSALYGDCKYLYKSTLGRLNEDMFGSHGCGESQFCIRCTQTYRDKRCFEAWMTQNCSDVYYSFNMDFCTECIFCFNLRNRKHCIGNVQLSPEKYAEAKARLLSEMARMLRRDKKLPSLMDILAKSAWARPRIPDIPSASYEGGKEAVEREFSRATKLVLGAELKGIDAHAKWLNRHTHQLVRLKSAASGKEVLFLPFVVALPVLPDNRLLTMDEALWLGEHSAISLQEAESISMENAHQRIGKLGFFPIEFLEGENKCITGCYMSLHTSYCYMTSAMVYAKYCACGMWPRSSEHCFGFDSLWDCNFCIKCYNSQKLQRCFECDSCNSCTDCYFCHNAENCRDCMFSFNAKNLSYAIGNTEYPKEEYQRIKKRLLSEIAAELEKKKDLHWNIYSIGAAKKKQGTVT